MKVQRADVLAVRDDALYFVALTDRSSMHSTFPPSRYARASQATLPVKALGPTMSNAILEHHAASGAAVASAAFSALATAHACVQDVADVRRPGFHPAPCAAAFTVIAPDGVDLQIAGIGLAPLAQRDHDHARALMQASAQYEVEFISWDAARKSAVKRLTRAASRQDDAILSAERYELAAVTARAKQELKALAERQPIRPKASKIIHRDISPASWQKALDNGESSILLLNLAADGQYPALLKRFNALRKSSYESTPLPFDGHSKQGYVPDHRVSMLLGVQRSNFFRSLARWRRNSEHSPALGAMLFVECEVEAGAPARSTAIAPLAIAAFHRRLTSLVKEAESRKAAGRPRRVVAFPENLEKEFQDGINSLRAQLAPGGRLYNSGINASQVAAQLASLACVLHLIESDSDSISGGAFGGALSLLSYLVTLRVGLFSTDFDSAQREADASIIEAKLWRSACLQLGPLSLKALRAQVPDMSTSRFDSAVALLLERGAAVSRRTGRGVFLEGTRVFMQGRSGYARVGVPMIY